MNTKILCKIKINDMGAFYLDIETNGLDETENKIITIQYAELERGTGKMVGDLTILKEWELGEKEMLQKFIDESEITSLCKFDFIPVGYNLAFENKFLLAKSKQYGLSSISVLSRPCIDLHSVGILMNGGEFSGSGLDKLTGKAHSGHSILNWYPAQKYDDIEDYITDETREFVKWYVWLLKELPILRTKWDPKLN